MELGSLLSLPLLLRALPHVRLIARFLPRGLRLGFYLLLVPVSRESDTAPGRV